jgi:glycolate oxidase FAD binding subunit
MSAPPLIDNIRPLDFVRPANVAELGDLVRRAAADSLGLFPIGGQTELHLGLPPNKPGIAVDLTHFDQVIDYPARDMTITVRAGITMGKLQALLAAENQRLPIDAPDNATLGGIIATNASGPRRYGYGTLRDFVIGISFMNDDGQEVKAGGRVVKNVAGYDLCKLQIGALGTLGIVTQVTLKLTPRPEAKQLMTARVTSPELPSFLDQIHKTQTRPVAINVDSPLHPTLIEAKQRPDDRWLLILLFEGNAVTVAWQAQQIERELPGRFRQLADDSGHWVLPEVDHYPPLEGVQVSFKSNLMASRLAEFLLRAMHLSPWPMTTAQAGNGIVLGDFLDDLTLDQASQILTELRQAAVAAQGNLIITRCPPAWKRELPVWGEPRSDRAMMRKVKQALDPRDLFNPGRFIV